MTWNVAPAVRTSRATRVRSSLPHERQGVLVEFRLGRSSSTFFAFCLATGRAFGAAETAIRMWKRTFWVLTLALAVGACRATALAVPALAGTGDVRVLIVHLTPGIQTYVVATVELTNDTSGDFTPDVSRFFLNSTNNERYQGTDSGSSALIGVSNAHRPLKQGDKRDYTVGFRTPDPVITGTISYEP